MHPRLAKALFRSLLRASGRGEHPEVFGAYGAAVFARQVDDSHEHVSMALPAKAEHVRERLKSWFRRSPPHQQGTVATNSEIHRIEKAPLDVLRQITSRSTSLSTTVPDEGLPIFDYEGIIPLPGERVHTLFLEPRYLDTLLNLVLESSSRKFLIRANPSSTSATLLALTNYEHVRPLASRIVGGNATKNVEHSEERSRRVDGVAVTALAGPTIQVQRTRNISVPHTSFAPKEGTAAKTESRCWNTSTKPLSVATQYNFRRDNLIQQPDEFNHQIATELRQYILNILQFAVGIHGLCFEKTLVETEFGLPPLDIESFSCWALKFVLQADDLEARERWLHGCTSSMERLKFIVQEVEDILEANEADGEESCLG